MIDNFYFRYGPIELALFVLVPLAVLYAVYMYRKQPVLSRNRRITLGVLRAIVYASLILLLYAPVAAVTKTITIPNTILVLLDISESMSIRDNRKSSEEMVEAAAALGKVPLAAAAEESPGQLAADVKAEVNDVSRMDLAKGILRLPELEFLRTPDENRRIASYTFGDKLDPSKVEDIRPSTWLDAAKAEATSTRLGDSLMEVVDKHGAQSITGVLILTDGASNGGVDPVDAARRLSERAIPTHTIGIGLTEPDDVRIQTVFVPDTVFLEDMVPVRVLLQSSGFDTRTVEVALTLDGQPVASKSVTLTGGTQSEVFTFVPDRKADAAKLAIAVSRLAGDVAPANNSVERSLRVIDEKIKVLYIEGSPRWEYRYLRGVLTRDHRLDVKFLLTEGDLDLAKASEEYIERFPDEAAEAFRYDLVIVGDVPADYFVSGQLERIEELVSKRGGSFLMLAGKQHAPASYRDTPIADVLPVKIGTGSYDPVKPHVHPVPTEQGLLSLMVSLAPSEKKTRDTWANVKPLYRLPNLHGVKPGAAGNILATLSDADTDNPDEAYPLVVWHRYGTGKSLFLATDQLWRLRKKHGDEYHARFWKQAIQFLTLSRLLGENKRIRLETDRRSYRVAERIPVYANVLDDSYNPVEAPSYVVMVDSPDREEPSPLTLQPIPGSPGLYHGLYAAEQPGSYHIKSVLSDQEFSSVASFEAVDASREMIEPAMQERTLRKISELTGGQYLKVSDLPKLRELLASEARTTTFAQEDSLWDRWYVYVILLGCLGTEWFVRRRNDVA